MSEEKTEYTTEEPENQEQEEQDGQDGQNQDVSGGKITIEFDPSGWNITGLIFDRALHPAQLDIASARLAFESNSVRNNMIAMQKQREQLQTQKEIMLRNKEAQNRSMIDGAVKKSKARVQ